MIKCSDCGCEGIHACMGKPLKKEDLPKVVRLMNSGEVTHYNYHFAVPLRSSILNTHYGNVSAFAKTQGVRYDQVGRWLKRNCMVVDGVVYCEVSKQVKANELDKGQ